MFIVWDSQVKSLPHQEGRQMPWVGGRAGQATRVWGPR